MGHSPDAACEGPGCRRSQLVSLAVEVKRLQGSGRWPGGPEPEPEEATQDGDDEMDEVGAHRLLAAAIASVARAGDGG